MTPADLFLRRLECRLSGPLAFFLGFTVGYLIINPLVQIWRG
jgi:hypothetical protein